MQISQKKKRLGRFFTTNCSYILQGFEDCVRGKEILDPFAGQGDLLTWAQNNGASQIAGLDIDPTMISLTVSSNDSLVSIPNATFNITNPPFLATNKMTAEQKQKLDMFGYEDLYLLSIKRIMQANPEEGILIIPVNFFSAINSDDLRREFMSRYSISRVNYFRQQVFEDTTYNVVAFHYSRSSDINSKQKIEFTFYPDKTQQTFSLERRYDFRIAGRALAEINNIKSPKVIRLTEDYMAKNNGSEKINALFNDLKTVRSYEVSQEVEKQIKSNIIVLSCIDTNTSEDGWIRAQDIRELGYDCLVGKNTSRNIAYLLLPNISLIEQEKIIPLFNEKLNALRKRYQSLFLTNFRDNDRKRVSFEFCYRLIAHCRELPSAQG